MASNVKTSISQLKVCEIQNGHSTYDWINTVEIPVIISKIHLAAISSSIIENSKGYYETISQM